jgi:PAS domain S-box-containing protein
MAAGAKTDLGAVVDALELPILVLNTDATLAGFNAAAKSVLGLTTSTVGRPLREADAIVGLAPDIEELTEHLLAGGAASQRELRMTDGAWFVVRATPQLGAQQKLTGIILTFTNVTGFRASVEQAIYEREYTKTILNTVVDPLVVLDTDLRVQTANKAFYTVFHISRQNGNGTILSELGNGEWNISRLLGHLRATLTGADADLEPIEVEMEIPSVGPRMLRFNARTLFGGERRAKMILLTAEDVTERRRAEQAIRDRYAQFEILLSEAPLGVYLVDDDFRIRAVNPKALPVFGDIPNLIGRDFAEVTRTLWPDRSDQIVARFRHTLETGDAHVVPETLEERRDRGGGDYYEWRISRIPLPDGRRGIVCYFRDISAQIAAREALADNQRRLIEASHRKDEFLATLAHELRNPLMPIRLTLTRMRRSSPVTSTIGDQLAMIDRQTTNLQRIVDDLLEVSRITSGKIELKKESFDLVSAINNAIESVRGLIAQRKHAVSVTFPSGPVFLLADPLRIDQVLTNLLVNAAKYTDPGGRIWISLERRTDQIEIRIRDEGIGIPEEMLPWIFEMFEQGRRDLARSTGGLGIGLSIVKKLTELHGGTIAAVSGGTGKGSEFILRLPTGPEPPVIALAPTGPEPAAPAARIAPDPVASRRILVVDDNIDGANSFAGILRDLGHDVRVVNEGQAALRMNSEWRAEIVFLDIGLPGMDGYEVARRIRLQNTAARLVALTGYDHASARSRSFEAGFAQHLVKPPALGTILAVLESFEAVRARPLQ